MDGLPYVVVSFHVLRPVYRPWRKRTSGIGSVKFSDSLLRVLIRLVCDESDAL
jgi:hypothetical protein